MYDYPIEQDVSNAYYNLIFFFIIMLMLVFFTYISFVASEKQTNRVDISKADFDLFENQANQPDVLLLGETNQNKKLDYSKIHDFAAIRFCPAGQCVVDLKEGTKRCPANDTDALSYIPVDEACSRRDYCDDVQVPYALRTEGSALDDYCGSSIPCRCLKNPQCAYNITSTFDMDNGSAYGVDSKQLNYFFTINSENNTFFNKNPIVMSPDDLGLRFCKINPAFTERINNGCFFSDNIVDPIDCNNSDLYQELTDKNQKVYLMPSNFNIYSKSTDIPNTEYKSYPIGTTTIYVWSDSKDPIVLNKGLYTFTNGGKDYYIYYNGLKTQTFIPNWYYNDGGYKLDTGDSQTIYSLENIISKEDNDTSWKKGIPIEMGDNFQSGKSSIQTTYEIDPILITYQPCTNQEPNANFKNMLRCVQPENQPCTSGTLTYNVDRIINPDVSTTIYDQNNSRNFCNAFDKTRLNTEKPEKFYLNDPASFTTGCMIGAGCEPNFDINLCTTDNCNNAIVQRQNNFYERYDQSAASNYWIISANEESNQASLQLTLGVGGAPTKIALTKQAMFSFEVGDYWARNNSNNTKFLTQNIAKGSTTLAINSIDGVEVGYSVLYPGHPDPLPTITSITDKTITINPVGGIAIDLTSGTAIEIINNLNSNEYGVIGGYKGEYYLLDISAQKAVDLTASEINIMNQDGIIIYKQFGFNGINYNTTYNRTGNIPLRYYSQSFVNGVFLPNTTTQPVFEFLGIPNPSLSQSDATKQAFENGTASFKNKKSMYYPVWNNSNFSQECIMCRPSFFAYSGITFDNKIQSTQIQFSAQQFYNYVHNITNDTFVYSSFTKIKPNSNSNYLILEDINNNIKIGDYILDSSGLFDRTFRIINNVPGNGDSINLGFIKPLGVNINNVIYDTITPNSFYQEFKITNRLGNQVTFTPASQGIIALPSSDKINFSTSFDNPAVNCFMGLRYQDSNRNLYEIIPVVKVIDIIDNVLITDAGLTFEMPSNEDIYIQTIRMDESLDIKIIQDPENTNKATGSGAAAKVSEISNGRISDLTIVNSGLNYSVENKPLVILSNFYSGEEINILTQ